MRFDLVDLRLFVRVATYKNLTKAAREVPMALGAASARIRALEHDLGVRLLERKSRGVELTAAGEVFLAHALAILQQVSNLSEDLMEFGAGIRGSIRLFANSNSNEFMPDLLSTFLAQNPQINIDTEEHLSQDIVQAIAEGRADLGIIAGNISTRGLEAAPFRRDRLAIITSMDHPLAQEREVRFSQVLDFPFVSLGVRTAIQTYLTQQASLLGRNMRVRVHMKSFDTVCRMVAAGVGVSVVPESTARRLQRSTNLKTVVLAEDWARRDLKLVVRSLDGLAPYSRKFFEYLTNSEPSGAKSAASAAGETVAGLKKSKGKRRRNYAKASRKTDKAH